MAIGQRNPNFTISLVLLSLALIASAEVIFEERFEVYYLLNRTGTLTRQQQRSQARQQQGQQQRTTCVSEVGTEISFKLPMSSSSSFERMFKEIESCMRSLSCDSEKSGSDICHHLGIESYGISVTTLEEVFLRVAGCEFDEDQTFDQKNSFVLPDAVDSHEDFKYTSGRFLHSKLIGNCKNVMSFMLAVARRACSLILATVLSFINCLTLHCCSYCMISRSTFWEHSKALIFKRAISAKRGRKTIVFQLLIPAVFLLFGLLLLDLKTHPDQKSVTFTTSHFNPLLSGGGGGGPIPFDLSWPISKEVTQYLKGGWIQRSEPSTYVFPDPGKASSDAIEFAGPTLGPILLSMSEFLMSSFNESYQSRYGAIVMDDNGSLRMMTGA